MEVAILLSLAASLCTATSSVCQRLGARSLDAREPGVTGFDPLLVFRLAKRPVWLLGFGSMIAGFAFQVSALHFGPLALVQPILAVELVFVFGYLGTMTRCRGLRWREWAAAAAMSGGLAVFLRSASPSGGRASAPGPLWWLAGVGTLAAVLLAVVAAGFGEHVSASRRAACLGIATGISWGFVAAVIKEMTSRLDGGLSAVFTNWAVYVLVVTGAGAMLLASHAITAGPLAASQPGFTLLDPIVAILLGALLFAEHLQAAPADLAGEVLGLLVLAAGVLTLSRSHLITSHGAALPPRTLADVNHKELIRKTR